MQIPNAAHAPDRYVVRPAGVLAEVLGDAEMGEDELLLKMRELGLVTYPSPLLAPLLEEWPDVLAAKVLARLDPADLVVFGQAARACRAAVVAFGVPQEEATGGESDSDDEGTGGGSVEAEGGPLLLRAEDLVGSVQRLAWARERGCRWDESVCAWAARYGQLGVLKWWDWRVCLHAAHGGHLEVLQWARDHGCEWGEGTCTAAAYGGHLKGLMWAHEQGCPWSTFTTSNAAAGGHLNVLQWAREQGCPWGPGTCANAARYGHLEVLQWARAHQCPWTEVTSYSAVDGGHLDVLRWAREHGCPWTAATRDEAAAIGYLDNLPLSV